MLPQKFGLYFESSKYSLSHQINWILFCQNIVLSFEQDLKKYIATNLLYRRYFTLRYYNFFEGYCYIMNALQINDERSED